jgi:hypothetical protein
MAAISELKLMLFLHVQGRKAEEVQPGPLGVVPFSRERERG